LSSGTATQVQYLNFGTVDATMPTSYGQFCPIAQAAEVLTSRWTLLVIRELLAGSTRFNDIRRGVPLMSSALLSTRLRELERDGIITRERCGARGHSYHLTDAGRALEPLVLGLGTWSRDRLQREITEAEADPALLLWDIHRNVRIDRLPQERIVTFFRFREVPEAKRAWWLVAESNGTDLCLTDPGFGVDLRIDADVVWMAQVWMGRRDLGAAIRARSIRVRGPEHLVRSLPEWIGLNAFAFPDPAAELARRRG
jgi:DNA-binding HxlR family transcriptional regulator